MQTIDLLSDDDYSVQALLDSTLYFLHFSWNTEGLFWTFAVEDYNHVVLLSGIKVLPNTGLIHDYYFEGLPLGELVAVSSSDTIAQTDFVDGYAEFVYVTEAEL